MRTSIPIRWTVLAVIAGLPAAAEIIDRIAASAGNQVITTSDLDRQIRVSAFLSGTKPDLGPEARRAALEGMIDQRLIRRELEASRYPTPAPEAAAALLDKLRGEHFKNEEDFRKALAAAGISEQDVKAELLWQRTLLFFVEDRFRPGVQVSEQDIQDYFNKVVAPAARTANPGSEPKLEDFHQRIEDTLTGERANAEMDRWLKDARSRTEIVYHPEALQ